MAEFVSHAFYCGDILLAYFLANLADVHVNRSRQNINVGSPDVVEQILAGINFIRVLREKIQKLKGANMDIDLASPLGSIAWQQEGCRGRRPKTPTSTNVR